MGYYYYTYEAHPESTFSFRYDGIIYAQTDHTAHEQAKYSLQDTEDYEYDIGVFIVMPIDSLVSSRFDTDDVEEYSAEEIYSDNKLLNACRAEVTESTLREVGSRQKKMDEGGEDIISVDVEIDESSYFR